MKRILVLFVLFLALIPVYGQSNIPIPLDIAIKEASEYIDSRITAKSKIALINFTSPSVSFSDYVIDELTANLVHSGHLLVVDRKDIDLIRGELNFQYSGEVDDNSMQELGRLLGAQSIMSGSLTNIGGTYRIVFRVLNVQTAVVEVQYRTNIVIDNMVTALLGETINIPPKEPATTADKIGTGALNVLFGLGSYLEGDVMGGITLTAGYAIAAGLFIIEAAALDWDSPAVGVPATIGITIAGITLVYGFARPFIYNITPRLVSVLDNTQFGIVRTSDNNTFQMTYKLKF